MKWFIDAGCKAKRAGVNEISTVSENAYGSRIESKTLAQSI